MAVNYAVVPSEDRTSFESAFRNLLKFQSLLVFPSWPISVTEENRGEKINVAKPPTETDGLYPLQALLQPISLRFKYHFEGTRQTNRLDKVGALS
jgi:RAD50-interacting protein 1